MKWYISHDWVHSHIEVLIVKYNLCCSTRGAAALEVLLINVEVSSFCTGSSWKVHSFTDLYTVSKSLYEKWVMVPALWEMFSGLKICTWLSTCQWESSVTESLKEMLAVPCCWLMGLEWLDYQSSRALTPSALQYFCLFFMHTILTNCNTTTVACSPF